MISRNLSKRVQKLETRLAPTDEPIVIQMIYVSPDGTRRAGPRITCGALRRPISAPAQSAPLKTSDITK